MHRFLTLLAQAAPALLLLVVIGAAMAGTLWVERLNERQDQDQGGSGSGSATEPERTAWTLHGPSN